MQESEIIEKIDLIQLLRSAWKQFRRSWWLAIFLMILAGGLNYVRERVQYHPIYTMNASFIVSVGDSDALTTHYYDVITTEQLNETFPYILTSGALSQVVAADLGYTQIPATIKANPLGDTNIFQIQVSGKESQVVSDVLDSVIDNYPVVSRYILGSTTLTFLDKSPIPDSPSNPFRPIRTLVKGAIVGVLLYMLVLLFQILSHRSVHDKKGLHQYINLPVLGNIPRVRMLKKTRRQNISIKNRVPQVYKDSVDALQAKILSRMEQKDYNSFYVTSAMAGEGKTTISTNLAMRIAEHGRKVILIDADLRNPSVSEAMGIQDHGYGLADYLKGKVDTKEVMMSTEQENLTVILGSNPIHNISNLFTNGRFHELIDECRSIADIVIVDTPPCAFVHDTAVVADYLDGGIMVVRQDYSPIERIVAGSELMAKTKAPLFGCLLNFSDIRKHRYGYSGYYGYYGYGYGYGEKKKKNENP